MSYSKISVKENEHRAEEIDREGERVGKREARALMHEAPPTQNPARCLCVMGCLMCTMISGVTRQ